MQTAFSLRWLSLFKERPGLFNSITGCILFSTSDALAQKIEHEGFGAVMPFRSDARLERKHGEGDFNYQRFFTTGLLGIFFGGFVYPKAYEKLDLLWPGSRFREVLIKSVVEIATVGIFVNSVSMAARGLLVGRKGEDVLPHVIQEMPRVTLNDIRVWMPYNLVAFRFIPALVRPTTTAMMEASWQTYISLRSHDYVHFSFVDEDSKSQVPR